eukprot:GFYU01006217.1.p1 GENE.GFYU01006217.1~~GFYU01006217.1.p1  ORF type:complete len:343 (-),score=91.93 GFYU01006217.1:224-1252(-)
MSGKLSGKVALVTGASRGIGRGVAIGLAEAGATVYITGRTLQRSSNPEDPNTLGLLDVVDSVEKIPNAGRCIAIKCDHSSDKDTEKVITRIITEQGKIDVLVNNAYGAVYRIFTSAGKPFWDKSNDASMWDASNDVGLRSNYICAHYAAQHMTKARSGLIVNMSSVGGTAYLFNVAYSTGKAGVDKMMADMAVQLKPYGVAAISLYPGPVSTELTTTLIDSMASGGVKSRYQKSFKEGETPLYTGYTVAALAANPDYSMSKTGQIVHTAEIGRQFNLKDVDGRVILESFSLPKLVATMVPSAATLASYLPQWCLPLWMVRILMYSNAYKEQQSLYDSEHKDK